MKRMDMRTQWGKLTKIPQNMHWNKWPKTRTFQLTPQHRCVDKLRSILNCCLAIVATITSSCFKTVSCLHVWVNDKDPSIIIATGGFSFSFPTRCQSFFKFWSLVTFFPTITLLNGLSFYFFFFERHSYKPKKVSCSTWIEQVNSLQ